MEYVFSKRCEVADRCPVAGPCQNLTLGRRYKVIATRPARHTVCTEHEEAVRAVEVEEMPIRANVPMAQLRGTKIRWKPAPSCTFRGCPSWAGCFESGLVADSQYVVKDAGAPVTCAMGYNLRNVRVGDA